jgi:hypothetical protein
LLVVRKVARKRVERVDWSGFLAAAEENYASACAVQASRKYRAAGILLVHAVIALTDALTVRAGGVKSAGEDHQEAIELVRELLPNVDGLGTALRHLEAIIHEKNRVSYTGDPYTSIDPQKCAKLTISAVRVGKLQTQEAIMSADRCA